MKQTQTGVLKSTERVYKGKAFSVVKYKYKLDSRTITRDLIERDHGVIIVPMISDSEVLLIREYCAGSNSMVLSLPGGSIDADEEPASAAARELREEVGYNPKALTLLHSAYSHPSMMTRRSFTFIASDLSWQPLPESHEIIEVERFALEDAIQAVLEPFASDVSTIGCLLMARRFLDQHEN
jgi:ADP-ribose diphosphatase